MMKVVYSVSFALAMSLPAVAGPLYTITDLGTNRTAAAINDAGHVTGIQFPTATTPPPAFPLAYLYNGSSFILIPPPAGGTFNDGLGVGINNLDHVAISGGSFRAYFWNGTSSLFLDNAAPPLAAFARGINDMDHITGLGNSPSVQRAFIWNGTMIVLGTLGGSSSEGWAINNSDHVTGQSQAANSELHGFYWDGTTMIDLGTLPGGVDSIGKAINNNNVIAGQSNSFAFRWSNGTMVNLGTLAGFTGSDAVGINDAGLIVGAATLGSTRVPVIWDGSSITNLNSILVNGTGWNLLTAKDINNMGQIVGEGTLNGVSRAFLLTPVQTSGVPEPATWAMVLAGTGAVLVSRKRLSRN